MLPTAESEGPNRHIVDALGDRKRPRVRTYSAGGIDEQAREAARRAGRATANPAMASEAGWPAWAAVAEQAGRATARAQAEHLAHAAGTDSLVRPSKSRRLRHGWGADSVFQPAWNAARRRATSSTSSLTRRGSGSNGSTLTRPAS